MPKVKLLPRAVKDLLELPKDTQEEILNKMELLESFPEMGSKMEKAFENYRCLLAVKNRYRIIYKVKSAHLVEVAYIRHCRRQMGLRIVH